MTTSDIVGFTTIITWGTLMTIAGILSARSVHRSEDEDEQLYREVYGPAGKPKKPPTAEPESQTRSAE